MSDYFIPKQPNWVENFRSANFDDDEAAEWLKLVMRGMEPQTANLEMLRRRDKQ